jgi:hypothetical protein
VVGILDEVFLAVKDLGGVDTMSVGDGIVALLPNYVRHLGLFLAVSQESRYLYCLSMSDLELLGSSSTFMEDAEFEHYATVVDMAEQHQLRQMGSLGLDGADAEAKRCRDAFPAPGPTSGSSGK